MAQVQTHERRRLMPIGDSRTPNPFPRPPQGKRRLGKRDAAPVDTDHLLNELRDAAVSVVARVLSVGGAIQFGSTRSRGAMLVRAWVDGDQYEDYVTSVAEFVATLEALDDVCEGAAKRGPRPVP
jgi:hypothetical protein